MTRELETFARLLDRDLATVEREVSLYPSDVDFWKAIPGQPTLGGNLVLHVAGNLRHFVGGVLGRSGYIRDRDREFADRGLCRQDLFAVLQATRAEVAQALASLEVQRLDDPFPERLRGHQLSTRMMLAHLCTHLAFHLGQLDYHRRAVTGDAHSAEPLGFSSLLDS